MLAYPGGGLPDVVLNLPTGNSHAMARGPGGSSGRDDYRSRERVQCALSREARPLVCLPGNAGPGGHQPASRPNLRCTSTASRLQ